MLRYTLFLAISFLSIILNSTPTYGQFTIRIINKSDSTGIEEAHILNMKDKDVAVSDKDGTVKVDWSPSTQIKVTHTGYNPTSATLPVHGHVMEIYLTPSETTLNEVIVQGFRDNRRALEIAGGVNKVNKKLLNQYDQGSLLPAFNALPGVRLEQRSPGSFRVSIRGSAIRSPFGVRNVKVYWNNIPVTEPGGDTQLNFFDLINLEQAEVIKGPASSLYGAGTGGVILFNNNTDSETSFLTAGTITGSYNYRRFYVESGIKAGNSLYRINTAWQSEDGYRNHSAFDRKVAQVSINNELSKNRNLTLHLLYTDLIYELPGALTPEQYEENPQQARPGSADMNASVHYNNLLLGTTHSYIGRNWENQTTLYSAIYYFDHPFNTDYKRELNVAGGGRTVFDFYKHIKSSIFKLSWGAEYQAQLKAATNFENRNGKPVNLNFSDDIYSSQYLLFAQASVYLPKNWTLTSGLSLNGLLYEVDRFYELNNNKEYIDSNFGEEWMPRLAFVKSWKARWAIHASLSKGFSPPTLREFRTNEGSLNTSLQAEKGTNYELGFRGQFLNGTVSFDISTFWLRLHETITSYRDSSGVQLFRNAGATTQPGVESALSVVLYKSERNFIKRLSWWNSYTFNNFTYQNYTQNETDFSGKIIPGTVKHTFVNTLDVSFRPGFQFNLYWNYTDKIPLNDDNTVVAKGYNMVRLQLSYELLLHQKYLIKIHAGSNNLLNKTLSLGNDLNPYGNRYFQPAADRTVYAGLRLSL